MSNKTFFKRAALVVVASLGLGFLTGPSSQAVAITPTLTLTSATATASVGDTATGSWTLRYIADGTQATAANADTAIVTTSCNFSGTGATCPNVLARQTVASDTLGVVINSRSGTWSNPGMDSATWIDATANYWGESATTGTNVNVRSAVNFKATGFTKAGTYTYTFLMRQNVVSAGVTTFSTVATATWTVTVTAPSTALASIEKYYFAPTNAQSLYWRGGGTSASGTNDATSRDSSIVTSSGTTATPVAAGVLYMTGANGTGDTRVAVADGFAYVHDTVTVSITGPGLLASDGGAGATKAKSVSVTVSSRAISNSWISGGIGESVTVYSDGTAGVGTITVTNAGGTLLTRTITFTGVPASATPYLSDTYTYYGAGSVNLVAEVKDAGGNKLQTGTLYVFSSDTNVVSAGATLYSNAATQYQTSGRCGNTSGQWSTTTSKVTCALTIGDSGTASIYLADSWNVTASSFVTTAITLTVTQSAVGSATVTFDKASYAPGERAVITITAKDAAARLLANGTGTFNRVFSNVTLTGITTAGIRGTSATDNTYGTSLSTYVPIGGLDSGVETRVVTMPTFGTDVTYTVTVPAQPGGVAPLDVVATAKVVDPVQNAQNTAIATAQAAADAATDAALQAIDAANAATDAANLAAEAADAATVAAQESKDSADAATAAVESLATQVATLMAALQAQITSLANVVAKIAKKVKA